MSMWVYQKNIWDLPLKLVDLKDFQSSKFLWKDSASNCWIQLPTVGIQLTNCRVPRVSWRFCPENLRRSSGLHVYPWCSNDRPAKLEKLTEWWLCLKRSHISRCQWNICIAACISLSKNSFWEIHYLGKWSSLSCLWNNRKCDEIVQETDVSMLLMFLAINIGGSSPLLS